MRALAFYLLLLLLVYVCQSVLFPLLLPPELRLDLILVLIIHASFARGLQAGLSVALLGGVLADVGSPSGVGGFHLLLYLLLALVGSLLWQNLNLQSHRYRAIFLGVCSLIQGGGLWIVLKLHNPYLAGGLHLLKTLAGRTTLMVLLGPLLLYGLEKLEYWLMSVTRVQEYQQG